MNDILSIFAPLLSVVVTIAATVLSAKLNEWLKLKNEKMLRDALHQSADNAVKFALGRGTLSTAVVDVAVDYVKSKNPDTLKKLKVSDKGLRDIIRTKSQQPVAAATER